MYFIIQKWFKKTRNKVAVYRWMCWILLVMVLVIKKAWSTFEIVFHFSFKAPSPSLCPGFKLWWAHVCKASWSTLCRTPDQPDKGECQNLIHKSGSYHTCELICLFQKIKRWTLETLYCNSVYSLWKQNFWQQQWLFSLMWFLGDQHKSHGMVKDVF